MCVCAVCWISGFVVKGRVHGQLAVSRAIGDSMFKTGDRCVIATPEVTALLFYPIFRPWLFDHSRIADVGRVH